MALTTRPPVVTILGHVDHGKTTLLDFIRKTAVAAKEHGGITQAIGAYQVRAQGKLITFIDTPGHAAFEKMRSRGAQVADIAVLVVAADDGIMPQTVEAIKHIQSAGVAMIVAVNKIDIPGINLKAQTDKIKRQLSDQQVLVEEYGGDVPVALVSAKTGQGVEELLETINLLAEINELKGEPNQKPQGVVIESHLDKFKGAVATVLVRDGSLSKGDTVVAGGVTGKIRGMFDWAGKALDKAEPSTPVEVLGFSGVPAVGAKFGEGVIQSTVTGPKPLQAMSLLDKLRMNEEEEKILNVVIRADKQGSLEAIEDIVESFNKDETHIKTLSSGTGDVVDSDVTIASASRAIILGFNVGITSSARKMAETEHVLIRTYNIIYELSEELSDVVEGILQPGKVEEVFGRAQIVAEFPYGKDGRIAGCTVVEGNISKGPKVRVVRGDEIIAEAKIKSLKKVREEVNKVEKGQDCGIMFDGPIEFKIGDTVENYRIL